MFTPQVTTPASVTLAKANGEKWQAVFEGSPAGVIAAVNGDGTIPDAWKSSIVVQIKSLPPAANFVDLDCHCFTSATGIVLHLSIAHKTVM